MSISDTPSWRFLTSGEKGKMKAAAGQRKKRDNGHLTFSGTSPFEKIGNHTKCEQLQVRLTRRNNLLLIQLV